jgi:hypothetical protein
MEKTKDVFLPSPKGDHSQRDSPEYSTACHAVPKYA